MNNRKVIILFVYVAFMIINSALTFSFESQLWKYDKYVHFIEFFILGILIINIFLSNLNFKQFMLFLLLILVIAMMDEGIQFMIPGRIPDLNDLYYDVLGGFSGMILLYLLKDKLNG